MESRNFIEQIIDKDLAEGVYDTVHTRFPPEPNGYLHIGHAKSILLNYGLAQEYGGKFNMRFDDTNPTKEKSEFVDSILADIRWLGADWEDRLFFASNYFDQMYEGAVKLIRKGKAYVSDLTADEMREYRGTLTEPGKEDPSRNRSVEENLTLFEKMKNGEADYTFIEVMGCPGGCVTGGGQPIVPARDRMKVDPRVVRAKALYTEDESKAQRKSHKNAAVQKLYEDYLGQPNSHKAHEVLHTTYVKRGL